MSRINSNDELWTVVSEVGIIRDVAAGESDTLNALASAGTTSLTETTGTNAWAAGDLLRIGTGSDAEVAIVEAYSTPTITLVSATMKDGVLELLLPKSAQSQPRRIAVAGA